MEVVEHQVQLLNLGPDNKKPALVPNGGVYLGLGFKPSMMKAENDVVVFETKAALKLQKNYRGYRTRRMLADSAVIAEELWWQAIDYARLNHSTVSFFNYSKPETTATRWARISLNASKVGKGLSNDDGKAKKLAFQHWIEAIDPRHRYGHSLHIYYEEWCKTDAAQPFFYWLDIGDGKEVDLEECPRSKLRQQCINYLGPREREHYEYVVVEGKIIHKQTGVTMDTSKGAEGAKWIFVMSISKKLYAGEKKKGIFHHSSFLAGGATLAAGRIIVVDGVLKTISAYSGHYRPTDDNLHTLTDYFKENGVKLEDVQIRSPTDDYDNYEEGSVKDVSIPNSEPPVFDEMVPDNALEPLESKATHQRTLPTDLLESSRAMVPAILKRMDSKKTVKSYQLGHQLSLKWTTGAGPRIGCMADYPLEMRLQALDYVNLSPRGSRTPSWFQETIGPSLLTPDLCNVGTTVRA